MAALGILLPLLIKQNGTARSGCRT